MAYCKPKELGYIVSIDQASNAAGVSLWKDGHFMGAEVLTSNSPADSLGKRLSAQVSKLETFLHDLLPSGAEVKVVLFEGVRSRLVLTTVGAFVTCSFLRGCKIHPRHSFIESASWKNWARKHGATAERTADIKGVKALEDIGWNEQRIMSDDIADSILMYLCWRDKT